MNWDQIENNWVAMTRRVRPERPATGTSSGAPMGIQSGERPVDALQPSGDMAEIAVDDIRSDGIALDGITLDGADRPVVPMVSASRQIA